MTADLPADAGRVGAPHPISDIATALSRGYSSYDGTYHGPALAPAAAAGVPDGYVLVPCEPTPEMLRAAWNSEQSPTRALDLFRVVWSAMLAASPAAPAGAKPTSAEIAREEDAYLKGYAAAKALFGEPSPGANLGAVERIEAELVAIERQVAITCESDRNETAAKKADPVGTMVEISLSHVTDAVKRIRGHLDAVRDLALPSAGAAGLETVKHAAKQFGIASSRDGRDQANKPSAETQKAWSTFKDTLAALERGTGAGAVSGDIQRALAAACDPAQLRTAVMMEGAHLSQQQACDIIREDRLGLRSALERVNDLRARIAAEGRARPAGGEG